LLGSQVALVVHGLTDAVTWGTRPAVVVWAVWGVAMASWNLVVSSEHHVKAVQNLAHVPDHSG
jgi:hypothetical protein